MAQTVKITPASGLLEFIGNTTSNKPYLQHDDNGNLTLTLQATKKFTVAGNLKVNGKVTMAQQTLTDGAAITWDFNSGANAKVTIAGARTLVISNMEAGDTGLILVKQDAAGSRTLILPGSSSIVGGGSYTASPAANATDVLGVYYDGTTYWWTIGYNTVTPPLTSVGITGGDFVIANSPLTANGNIGLALATVNSTVGTFGSATAVPVITVNAKGLVTAVSATNISIPTNLDSLTDVTITSAATNQLLQFNGSQWVNWSPNYLTQAVTLQDTPPAGVDGKLWWETDTGKLKVYYGAASAWVDALPMPDMTLYLSTAGGAISGDLSIAQTLTVTGNILTSGNLTVSGTISASGYNNSNWNAAYADKINSAGFNTTNGILTLTQQDGGTVTVDLDGRYLTSETDSQSLQWDAANKNLTISNGNTVTLDGLATEEFVTGQGYITGYTETNTFLGDGGSATTHPGTDRIIFTGQLSLGAAVLGMPSTDNSNAILNINRHPGEYNSQLGFSSNGSMYYRSFSATAINNTQAWRQVWDSGNLTDLNQLTNGPAYITSAALSGYATQTYVNTAVSNLIDAAPSTLDTLNELAAALGDDPNFATSFTTLIGNKVSKAGDTMTGVLTINTNAAGLILNRDAVSNYNGIYYSTANVPKWFIGMRENLGSNNHIHYSEELTRDILTLNVTNGNATVFGTITASNFSGSSSGTNTGDQTNISGNAATATALTSMNISQFTNNSGYITSYSETDTLYSVTNRGNSTIQDIEFTNGRKGLVGRYNAAQTQAVFSMGYPYVLDDGAASGQIGNLYGLAWSYNPNYGGAGNNPQSIAGLNHQLLLMQAGVTTAAMGSGIWTSGNISAANFSGSSSGTNTGDQTNISGNAATATNAVAASNLSLTSLGTASVNVNNGSSAVYRNENGSGGNLSYAPVLHLGGGDTMWQIQGDYYDSSTLRWRAGYNGTWYAWRDIIHSGNIGSQSVLYAATAGALTSMNISQFTNNSGYLTALPSHNHDDRYYTESESDLRFAALSHSHTFASLTSKPTTISGYGITDAITTGNIGSQSVNYATYAAYVENDSYYMRFHWSGLNGQPTWLWGGDEGENMYVYDPSNFSVNYANSAGALSSMNISQFTNNSGYLTAETDTLASVTGRGASTTTALSLNGKVTFSSTVANRPQVPGGILGLDTGDGDFDIWGISRDYYPSHATAANAWGLRWNGANNDFEFVGGGTSRVILDMDGGNLTITGTISASGYNSANWNTAYGWGNHASAGYLTSLPSHNHDDRYYTESEIDSQIGNRLYQARVNSLDVDAFNGTGLYRGSTSSWSNRPPIGNNAGALLQIDTHPSDYAAQLFFDSSADRLYLRNAAGGSWGSWNTMWHSGNDGSGSSLDADLLDGFHASVAATANSIPTRNASGYLIPESWIQLNGTYGLYSSTNGAHFYPNNGSYGSWRIEGSRNDYRGLQFATGINGDVSLMIHVNSNITGFHNAAYDWQFYWTAGTLYCFKDNYGGGEQATVLDSVNYTDYAATSGHTHDDRYYTETEINNLFSAATAITGYNKSNWDAAYNKRPTAISFSGTGTKTLTLTQGDGSTLTASFSDIDTDTNTDAQTLTLNGSTLSISGGNSITLPTSGISQGTADSLYVNVSGDTMTGALRINGSTLGQELFAVDGTNGRLFTVTDDLSDSLYSVNTLAGLPVLEVFANNVVKIGKFGTNAIYVGQDGRVGFGTTDFSYTTSDTAGSTGTPNANRVFVNGSVQLIGSNDGFVVGRSGASFFKDEEIAFGWGGGWFMEDATYLRVRGNKMIYSGGSARFDDSLYLGGQTYRLYSANSGLYTNGNLGAAGDMTATYFYGAGSIRVGDMWGGAGLYRPSGSMVFGIENSDWIFSKGAVTQAYFAGGDGNLWMRWAGDWLSNLLEAKQNASTAINTGNIGSQSVNYATTAGSANSVAWTNVSSRPTALSQFSNDLGNYGGWITSSGSISGNAGTVTNGVYTNSSQNNLSGILNFGSAGATPYNNPTGTSNGISFGGIEASSLRQYGIFTEQENIGGNYSKLTINYHTGIRLGASSLYGGTRFYNDAAGSGTVIFSVGNGDNHVRVLNNLYVTGTVTGSNLSGTNTGDQTNISGNAATATNVAWTGVTSRPTALSQFTNDLGNYGGFLTSLPSHNHDGVYVPINPDGDGPSWSYADNNPTINGKYVGGGQRFGADGSVDSGFLQSKHLNAYDGHVNSSDGYYVGVIEYGSIPGEYNTTQVIDSAGRWTGAAVADDKIASSANWNTAYGWGNHAGAGYQAASTAITTSNIGSQSVSNASTAGGLYVHNNRNNEANKIVRTDANGYIQAGWINTTSGAFSSAINKIYCSDDDYMRYQTPANFISNLGLITTSNIGSQSVNYAASAGAVAWTNVSGRPTALSQFTNDLSLGGAVVTIQDSAPAGTAGQLWWESDTGKLKVYYSSVWVDATPVPDMSLYYAKAGGSIDGDVTIRQTLTVVGNTLIQGVLTETSDISLKENILPLESSLDKLMKLNGVSFNKKTTPHVKEIGFIAQEVEEIIPDLVTETSDGIKTVAYSRVSAILVETIKEQQTQITELKEMVNILTKKINDL